jgi:hypothetical protein
MRRRLTYGIVVVLFCLGVAPDAAVLPLPV